MEYGGGLKEIDGGRQRARGKKAKVQEERDEKLRLGACSKEEEKRVRGDDGWAIAPLGAIGLSSLRVF